MLRTREREVYGEEAVRRQQEDVLLKLKSSACHARHAAAAQNPPLA